ncbi:hypothetical protein [Variovorax paradoxus]|uniref:Uncharacterized protein n=1 Tax=Variovorax paradoxus TaxID=34073 RepID=A0A0H2ML49_VARPD|nr:hypothetical protein [Variovorax paradoxus]KLN57505.1 hypothetical protein VPARA_15860 [Variovorax paradoxus]
MLNEQQTRLLRAAFTGAGTVQYYACNFDPVTSAYDTCAATETGTVEIRTEGGARVLVFNGGHPPTGVGSLRTFGEYGGAVYVVRGTKSDTQYNVNKTSRITLKNGRQVDAQLQLQAAGGTWRTLAQNPGDPCVGIPTPTQWRRVESGVYELHLQGSKALTGCRDNLITFQQLDAGTLRGRSDAGAEIVLTRR